MITTIYNHQRMSLRQAAQLCGVSYDTLRNRYVRGWRGDALFQPVITDRSTYVLTYGDKTQSLKQWAEDLGVSYETLRQRIKAGALCRPESMTTRLWLKMTLCMSSVLRHCRKLSGYACLMACGTFSRARYLLSFLQGSMDAISSIFRQSGRSLCRLIGAIPGPGRPFGGPLISMESYTCIESITEPRIIRIGFCQR